MQHAGLRQPPQSSLYHQRRPCSGCRATIRRQLRGHGLADGRHARGGLPAHPAGDARSSLKKLAPVSRGRGFARATPRPDNPSCSGHEPGADIKARHASMARCSTLGVRKRGDAELTSCSAPSSSCARSAATRAPRPRPSGLQSRCRRRQRPPRCPPSRRSGRTAAPRQRRGRQRALCTRIRLHPNVGRCKWPTCVRNSTDVGGQGACGSELGVRGGARLVEQRVDHAARQQPEEEGQREEERLRAGHRASGRFGRPPGALHGQRLVSFRTSRSTGRAPAWQTAPSCPQQTRWGSGRCRHAPNSHKSRGEQHAHAAPAARGSCAASGRRK